MRELRDHFDSANRLTAPDLWPEIETRRPGTPPPPHRRLGTIVVALFVTALAMTVLAVALWPAAETTPSSEASPAPTTPGEPPALSQGGNFDFVPFEVESSEPRVLQVTAPAGQTLWVVGPCRVEGSTVDSSDDGSTGFIAKCVEDDGFVVMTGGMTLAGRFYVVAIGQAPADAGYRVRVTLGDGRQTTQDVIDGLWIVVTAAVGEPYDARPDADSQIHKVELIGPDGTIHHVEDVPPDPSP